MLLELSSKESQECNCLIEFKYTFLRVSKRAIETYLQRFLVSNIPRSRRVGAVRFTSPLRTFAFECARDFSFFLFF